MMVNVLQEILAWSVERPTWQRDALRRLVTTGELSDDDIRALTEICKGDHGLVEKPEAKLLATEDVPPQGNGGGGIACFNISPPGRKRACGRSNPQVRPGLTIVYGDNGAGKTGYIRILKQACRARGQEAILGNVVSGTARPDRL